MEARESQRELMQQAALDDEASTKPSSSSEQENIVVNLEDRPFFNPSVRETIDDRSTVTSLESVVCDDARTEHDKDIIEPIAKEDQVKDRDSIRPYPYPYPCDPSKLLPKKKKRRN